ncbi:hypothetical protein ASPVEDRAFT_43353 [Aspergillus versicolor CBS 583.65]|uniref:Uncharacterized protein n=1 Tax=Aspergillus versicolor CBS 583.65 TaxID=1036611 RepID=A0A1L9PQQ7_ASPVE|nr:uncharacterized protein ASPVEDRAFT_43353 [Aspergillus versicolor CBS 583.65]OJJ03850.1 hypothetical protein ASPVEDRAFT_43353 [Aspergillus versicolor CBS 583.65]
MVKKTKPGRAQTPMDQLPIQTRLNIKKYTPESCNDALHGRKVPIGLGYELTRACVIRGIRHHPGFARELHGVSPDLTRALNARDIMSGTIPTMSESDPAEIPYCIWYPEIPSQDTLRALVEKYPNMLYHAARACAVAGYINLYKELNPLPEVHVAEEARHAAVGRNNKGSEEIWENIAAQPLKFAIMNDYARTVDLANPRPATLNGDTAVYSSLTGGREHLEPDKLDYFHQGYGGHYRSYYFNITEDWCIDDHDHEARNPPESYYPFLYGPLPTDLPPINKDKLILVAAYSGDIDRYARLRRPQMIQDEFLCIIRGIYHNPFWAKWWSDQITNAVTARFTKWEETLIQRAINGRRTMSDDVTWVTADMPKELLPLNIWFPQQACQETYERLAHIRPDVLHRCLYACIVADYPDLWDRLLLNSPQQTQPVPDSQRRERKLQQLAKTVTPSLWMEAKDSRNDYYRQDIMAAVPNEIESLEWEYGEVAHALLRTGAKYLFFPRSSSVDRWVDRNDPVHVAPDSLGGYDGAGPTMPALDFAVFLRDVVGVDNEVWRDDSNGRLDMDEVYELLDRS